MKRRKKAGDKIMEKWRKRDGERRVAKIETKNRGIADKTGVHFASGEHEARNTRGVITKALDKGKKLATWRASPCPYERWTHRVDFDKRERASGRDRKADKERKGEPICRTIGGNDIARVRNRTYVDSHSLHKCYLLVREIFTDVETRWDNASASGTVQEHWEASYTRKRCGMFGWMSVQYRMYKWRWTSEESEYGWVYGLSGDARRALHADGCTEAISVTYRSIFISRQTISYFSPSSLSLSLSIFFYKKTLRKNIQCTRYMTRVPGWYRFVIKMLRERENFRWRIVKFATIRGGSAAPASYIRESYSTTGSYFTHEEHLSKRAHVSLVYG